MPKIIKFTLIYVLAFFILDILMFSSSVGAEDVKTLKNGLRVITREDHRNPIVVFSVFVDIGSASEGEYSGSGISHLLEHMLFKGTEKYPPGAIENILHTYGGKINAFTSRGYTGFRITILKEHTDIAMDVLKEMLTSPSFDAEELEKEMQVIEREMDMNNDDPARRISGLTFSTAYMRHPYRIPIIGYRENFKRLGRDDLVSFFKSNYTSEKTIITVVGDMDESEVLGSISNLFGEIPRGKNVFIAMDGEPEQIAENYLEEKADIEGAYLNIAFHSTSLLNKDLYAMDLLSFILGQGESSILNEKIRIEKELALSVSSYNYTPRYPGLFVISAVLREKDAKKALDEILKEVFSVTERGVTNEEMTKAKNNFLAGYIYQKETIESQANDMALGELLTGNPDFFELYTDRIRSVTLDDIRRVAGKYLTRDNMTVTVLSKSGNTRDFGLAPVLQKELREVEKIVLKNGLSVLVSQNSSLPILSVSLVFKGGLRSETEENNGISKITSSLLTKGTDSMTREEIARSYESKGMSVSTYSGNNSVGISVRCLKEYTEDALKLISEMSMDSLFPEKELEREKKELISAIDMQDNTLFNYGRRLLKKLLFKSHPYGFQTIGTKESVNSIKRKDVAGFYENLFSVDNVVLGVSGDCDVNEIKKLTGKYFSKKPLKKSVFTPPKKEAAIDNVREKRIKTEKDQSLILLGFRSIDIYNKEKFPAEVMVDIISSESGILFKNIREENGLSYATGAFQVFGIDPGYIAIYALTSKENISRVKDIMFKEIKSFVKNGPSGEELQKSKNHLKAMRQMSMQRNSDFIFSASLDELYGLGYNNYKDYETNIGSVTKEDVKRVAKKILTLNKYALVILEGRE